MVIQEKDVVSVDGISSNVAGTALWITIGMIIFFLAGLLAVRLGVGWEKSLYEASVFAWIAVHYFSGVGAAILCVVVFKK